MPHFAKRPRLTFEPNFQTQSQMQGLMVAGAPVDEEEEKKKKELEEKEEEEETASVSSCSFTFSYPSTSSSPPSLSAYHFIIMTFFIIMYSLWFYHPSVYP